MTRQANFFSASLSGFSSQGKASLAGNDLLSEMRRVLSSDLFEDPIIVGKVFETGGITGFGDCFLLQQQFTGAADPELINKLGERNP